MSNRFLHYFFILHFQDESVSGSDNMSENNDQFETFSLTTKNQVSDGIQAHGRIQQSNGRASACKQSKSRLQLWVQLYVVFSPLLEWSKRQKRSVVIRITKLLG